MLIAFKLLSFVKNKFNEESKSNYQNSIGCYIGRIWTQQIPTIYAHSANVSGS